ncbi:hypothetical protein ACHAWX_002140, partial [Stephanocyclus meneghinianus]
MGEYMPSHTATYMGNALIKVMHFYSRDGFVFPFVIINTSAACEHVAEIKRCIHTVEARSRCIVAGMPFTHLLAKVIAHLVYYAIFLLNAFPAKLGISDRLFPQEIAPQQSIDFKKDCCT